MNSNNNRRRPTPPPANVGRPKRKLKSGPLLFLIFLLLIGNLLWLIAWLIPDSPESGEEVASVSGKAITRGEWMAAMEEQHGRDMLLELVNQEVMETAAKEYDIKVSEEEIELELAMLRSVQDDTETTLYAADPKRLKDKVKAQLILEKVLTKDIVIEESKIEEFYKQNQALYDIKDAYRTRMIIVASDKEAKDAMAELENGSSFEALARERSLDTATGSLGGDVGYVSAGQSSIDPAVAKAAASLEVNDWSTPLTLKDGRKAIISVTEKADGQKFSFEEVKGHISRELALEQLPQSVTPEAFWKEFDAEWFYGE
ncbi:peptidyl-prolyl cis-trans isomerase [Planococcus sp. N017]|uniref:peptidylprolyl isomerase n=2 Tax=Planococcus shenhongbingii TaxID=3058398 RepID=A0ABT8NI57_9BACL|nr:peptidyl-prolyl cis-trans isomerase [Planococcus sp. N017]MDN7247554.1 peptidyl-prolyl cis-trans isomerase [Planococcus sp. N017]